MVVRVHLASLRSHMVRLTADALLLAGICALGFWAWETGEGLVYQYVQRAQFETAMTADETKDTEASATAGTPGPLLSFPARAVRKPLTRNVANLFGRDPQLIGRLDAPGIDLSVMLREGVDDDTLRKAAGHLPSSALPGEPGNFVVLGHRDSFFRPLRHIERGDSFRVVTAQGRFTYVVESFEVTDPELVKIVEGGPDRIATLITCFPFSYIGPAPKRLVVHARLKTGARTN